MVNGGLSGCLQLPNIFLRPQSDHLILSWCASESGSGQPCAMCQALTPDKYLPIMLTETGSKGQSVLREESSSFGLVTAQIANEWRSSKEAGRRSLSIIEKMLQKRWNFQSPEP
jgi:hypothetical protein